MIELTPEQAQAIAEQKEPLQLVCPLTQEVFVLVRHDIHNLTSKILNKWNDPEDDELIAATPILLSETPATLPDELVEILLAAGNVRIERIFSLGHASPPGFWYDQDQDEWVIVLQGMARLRFENEEPTEMKPGSFINIPAHRRHRVEWTTPEKPTIWLAVHYTDSGKS